MRSTRGGFLGTAFSGLIACALLGILPVAAVQVPPGFEDTIYIDALNGVSQLAWAPDGSLYAGQKGGLIRFVSTADGKQTGEIKLDTRPAFDGMSAAHGRLFVVLNDGRVLCLK